MKTYQEFISEAKKCWPGYKKKGTQKLFGKTYNRCVKESYCEFCGMDPCVCVEEDVPPYGISESKEAKKCPDGKYWCFDSKKCKKIPKGWHVMRNGYLMKDEDHEDDENGESGNNGSSDGGGVSESWSAKYKKSIDCNNPKGFSQRAHCQGRKKKKLKEQVTPVSPKPKTPNPQMNNMPLGQERVNREVERVGPSYARSTANAIHNFANKYKEAKQSAKNIKLMKSSSVVVPEEFKQMPGELMNKQMNKLSKSQSDLRKGRQTEKKRNREIKYDMQMKSIQMAGKQDYNRKGESYGQFWKDPLKTGKIRNPRFR